MLFGYGLSAQWVIGQVWFGLVWLEKYASWDDDGGDDEDEDLCVHAQLWPSVIGPGQQGCKTQNLGFPNMIHEAQSCPYVAVLLCIKRRQF